MGDNAAEPEPVFALSAQFQSCWRGLHDEAVQVRLSAAITAQQPMLQVLLTQGRKLDGGNPRRSALGSDFVRLGFDFVADLKAKGPLTVDRLEMLEVRKNRWPGGASPADRR